MAQYIGGRYLDYGKSFSVYKTLLTTNYKLDSYPPACAENETFGPEFPGALIRKPQYTNCTFVNSFFDSSDGALSRLHNCRFYDCTLNNCDFRYSDVYHSNFSVKQASSKITSCNFSFSNFIGAKFHETEFSGCSFRQMQFEDTCFEHCQMEYSSIEQSSFKNCKLIDLDLSKVSVRYCSFENVIFENVTFHILNLARNFGLINLLMQSHGKINIAYGNDGIMTLSDAMEQLNLLIPYYTETRQFYELVNVYAANNNYTEIVETLPMAFESVVATCDFAALQDLCTLVVKLKICNESQLRSFYGLIKQLVDPTNYPHYLRKSYNSYIENIKHILVDNPYNYPEARILLKTDIETLADSDMSGLLNSIETNIRGLAPSVDASIQLTHHSPYDVLIVLYGALPELLTVCQVFYYALGGMKAYSDLKHSLKEKAKKNEIAKVPANSHKDKKSVKRVELSVGKVFSFKYEKEYTKRVESIEYSIN